MNYILFFTARPNMCRCVNACVWVCLNVTVIVCVCPFEVTVWVFSAIKHKHSLTLTVCPAFIHHHSNSMITSLHVYITSAINLQYKLRFT